MHRRVAYEASELPGAPNPRSVINRRARPLSTRSSARIQSDRIIVAPLGGDRGSVVLSGDEEIGNRAGSCSSRTRSRRKQQLHVVITTGTHHPAPAKPVALVSPGPDAPLPQNRRSVIIPDHPDNNIFATGPDRYAWANTTPNIVP